MISPFIFLSIVSGNFNQCSTNLPYATSPLNLGVEVFGINLKEDISPETVTRIEEDLWKHRLLVFRDQDIISGERMIEIARLFGEIDSSDVIKHDKAPSRLIARFSNHPSEGIRNIGKVWHVDGISRMYPYPISFFHIVFVSKDGHTKFVGLREVIDSISPEQKQEWDRLWVTSTLRPIPTNPLIYQHQIRKEQTLSINLNTMKEFIVNLGSDNTRITNSSETHRIIEDIRAAIERDDEKFVYSHQSLTLLTAGRMVGVKLHLKWKNGDFIISDNMALGHKSSEENHLPPSQIGLRVLHRVTLVGTYKPNKGK